MPSRFSQILILSSGKDAFSAAVVENVTQTLRRACLFHSVHCLKDSPSLPDLGSVTVVLICTENLDSLSPEDATRLDAFVSAGGGLGILCGGNNDRLNALFGILPPHTRPAYVGSDYPQGGLRFPGRALPAFAGISLDQTELGHHSAFDHWILPGVEIVATTFSGKPIAWKNSHGTGRILYWNTTFLREKRARGLIIETIQCLQRVAVLPIVNASVLQVDDFPAPLSDTLHGAVASEFPKLSGSEFYAAVWYRDILKLTDRTGTPATFFCIFDYSDPGFPPFTPLRDATSSAVQGDSETNTFAAIRALPPPEVGLHGYNHLSLLADLWPDAETMQAALTAALKSWEQMGLGPLPTSYVPPNNAYDATGIAALCTACPSIRSISGDHIGGPEAWGGSREFGPEPWQSDLFCLPRVTAGYRCTQETLFDAASQIAAFGVWTHFIHADDVCDTPENSAIPNAPRNPDNQPWRGTIGRPGLLRELERLLLSVKRRFPWLRGMTTTAGADAVAEFLATTWKAEVDADTVTVSGVKGGYFQLRLNGDPRARIADCVGGTVLHRDTGTDFASYVVRQEAAQVSIAISHQSRMADLLENVRQRFRA